MSEAHYIGQRIRAARKERRMTLERVADQTRLSIGFLSQVERHLARPSLSSLHAIAKALDVPIGTLIGSIDMSPAEAIPTSLSRRSERAVPSAEAVPAVEPLSAPFPHQQLQPTKIHIPAWLWTERESHAGEEFVFVLLGAIRCMIESQPYDLQRGDSIRFSAIRLHGFQNLTGDDVEVLSVTTGAALRREDLDQIIRTRTVS